MRPQRMSDASRLTMLLQEEGEGATEQAATKEHSRVLLRKYTENTHQLMSEREREE